MLSVSRVWRCFKTKAAWGLRSLQKVACALLTLCSLEELVHPLEDPASLAHAFPVPDQEPMCVELSAW